MEELESLVMALAEHLETHLKGTSAPSTQADDVTELADRLADLNSPVSPGT